MDKHTIEIQQNYQPLNLLCFGCEAKTHFANTCPTLHYVPSYYDKQRMYESFNLEEEKRMKQYERHEKVRYNARGCLGLTQEVAKEIKFVYKKEQEEIIEEDDKQPMFNQ